MRTGRALTAMAASAVSVPGVSWNVGGERFTVQEPNVGFQHDRADNRSTAPAFRRRAIAIGTIVPEESIRVRSRVTCRHASASPCDVLRVVFGFCVEVGAVAPNTPDPFPPRPRPCRPPGATPAPGRDLAPPLAVPNPHPGHHIGGVDGGVDRHAGRGDRPAFELIRRLQVLLGVDHASVNLRRADRPGRPCLVVRCQATFRPLGERFWASAIWDGRRSTPCPC